jgi:iron-sulfur cluster assembly protein
MPWSSVKLFLPAESRLLLDGVTIDFADTATQTGLVFHDPKQVSCSSHALKALQD